MPTGHCLRIVSQTRDERCRPWVVVTVAHAHASSPEAVTPDFATPASLQKVQVQPQAILTHATLLRFRVTWALPPQVSVSVAESHQPCLASIRAAMDALSAAGDRDTPEAQRLVNEYRMATGDAKVDSVVDFLRGLPGLQGPTAAAAGGQQAGSSFAAAAAAGRGGGAADDDDVVVIDGNSSDDQENEERRGGAMTGAGAGAGGGEGRGKVLVFAHHQSVLDALQQQLCVTGGLGYVRIDGRTSAGDRQVRRADCVIMVVRVYGQQPLDDHKMATMVV